MSGRNLRKEDDSDNENEAVEGSANDVFDPVLQKKWGPISEMLAELNRLHLDEEIRKTLPRLCITGIQSSGKSSLVEMMVGLECLPRGSGTVTRRPTEIYIVKDPAYRKPAYELQDSVGGQVKKCADRTEFQQKLKDMNFSVEEIVNKPIIATIRWANAFNFVIIDIPGIIATDKVTETITMDYISEPNTIILCVLPSCNEEDTSQAFVAVRKVDPTFKRTVFVRTKFDLLLNNAGEKIQTALTIGGQFNDMTFCTLNRTNEDNNNKVSIRQIFANEDKLKNLDAAFIQKSFPNLRGRREIQTEIKKYRDQIGTVPLIEAIIEKFADKVRVQYPNIIRKLEDLLEDYVRKQKLLPEEISPENREKKFYEYCHDFLTNFDNNCNGKQIGVHDAIEVLIRQKSAAKHDEEKKYLAERIESNPVELLLLWMEASGMQPNRDYVNQIFLNKCIVQTIEKSKMLTDRMFEDIHRHILNKLQELFGQSKFNRTMRAAYMAQIEAKLKEYKADTEDLIRRQFYCEMKYPMWEPDDYDREQPNLSFNYIDQRKNPLERQVYTLSRKALEERFAKQFGMKFRGVETTVKSVKKQTDTVMSEMLQEKEEEAQPQGDVVISHEFKQSSVREHLYKLMQENRKNPAVESKFLNNIMNAHLDKIEDQLSNILTTVMKSFTFCYFMLRDRKNFAAALICGDYLDKLKVQLVTILRNPAKLELMGEDPESRQKRTKINRNVEDISQAIRMVQKFVGVANFI